MKNDNVKFPVMQQFGVNLMPDPIIDEAANETYYGYAQLGTEESEAGWMIKRVKKTGTVTKTEYANGSMEYSFKWSDRASYSYSR